MSLRLPLRLQFQPEFEYHFELDHQYHAFCYVASQFVPKMEEEGNMDTLEC